MAALNIASAQPRSSLEPGILITLNRLRADPAGYASVLKQQRQYFDGRLMEIPGHGNLVTKEGIRPLEEAIAALASIHGAIGRVALSEGLSRAAYDHVIDTGRRGLTSHTGADGSDPTTRMSRHGVWSGTAGEVISYGVRDADDIINQLLIDDGVANRGHRNSLLNPSWRYAGIACGFHGQYGTMCVIDFAADYQ